MSDTRKTLTPCPSCGEDFEIKAIVRGPSVWLDGVRTYQFEKDCTARETYTMKRCPKCGHKEELKDE